DNFYPNRQQLTIMPRESKVRNFLRSDGLNSERATIEFLSNHVKYLERKARKKFKDSKLEKDAILNRIEILNKEIENLRKEKDILTVSLRIVKDIMKQFKDPKTEELLRHIQVEMKKSLRNAQSPKPESSSEVLEIFDVDMQEVETKKTWNNILDNTDVLLAIMSYLSPKDLFYFMQVQKYLYYLLKSNDDDSQSIWRVSRQLYFHQNFKCPIQLSEQDYFENKDMSTIRLELVNDQYFPSELLPAIYSVDIEQLQGRYMDFTIRDHHAASHM
ncbi:13311_t:CDS:2, partial [Racocetra persica]